LNFALVRPGAESVAWLWTAIAEAKGADPLGPVTVVVPSNRIGLALRRRLALQGCANVRFGVIGLVVEPFGAPARSLSRAAMRKIREALRLTLAEQLSRRQVSASLGIPFHDHLRIREAGHSSRTGLAAT